MYVVSVATAAMWPQARVIARSLRRHHPDWELEVVLVGRGAQLYSQDDGIATVSVEQLLGLDAEVLLSLHESVALVNLLVPRVLRERTSAGRRPLLHLPASTWVLGDLEPVEAALAEGGIMLAPRAAGDPPDDGQAPSARELAAAGRIAPDLMAIDGSPRSQEFLSWWIHRLDAIIGSPDSRVGRLLPDEPHGVYRNLELAPTLFGAAKLEDPGCNLSFWNLHEHTLRSGGSGFIVDERWPLRFVDFSGFDPHRPYTLNAVMSRVRLSRSPTLRALTERYAEELLESGWFGGRRRADVGRRLANGLVFDSAMERLHAEARMLGEDSGDVFSEAGTHAFMRWLTGPAPRGAVYGVNRYVFHRVMRERSDVAAAFPELDGSDGPAFVTWCHTFGRDEMDFPVELLPQAAPPSRSASGSDGASNAAAPLGMPSAADAGAATAAVDGALLGVRVTGYLGHVLGLGSAARGYAQALAAAGVPVSTVTLGLDHLHERTLLSADYGRHSYKDVLAEGGHAFELVCVNPDELPDYVERLGADTFEGLRIGVWGWEVNTVPARWKRAFSLIDEIWVYSRFVAENIGAVAPVPVVALPPPVKVPTGVTPWRLEVPDGFLFLFIFDYLSTIERKNPIGLIEAFKRAFVPGEGPRLLIKTINAPLRPLAEEQVLWATDGRSDIHVIDRSITSEEKDRLIGGCDCYVSLHRSEGFGLTMAEAMALGKPVIGTSYSGNVDFMNAANSLLVDYTLTRVGADVEIYPPDAEWAEPNVEHAAALMRRVYDDPGHAARLGARARGDIARLLSPETTGAAMRRRLEELAASGLAVSSSSRQMRRRLMRAVRGLTLRQFI
jgi:hypothetical protein